MMTIMIDETSAVDESRLIVPQLAGIYRQVASFGYVILRVVVALAFLPGGIHKMFLGDAGPTAVSIAKLGFPLPLAWAWTVAGLEVFGGIFLAIGLFTRPVAFAFAIELAVIAFGIMGPRGGYFWTSGGVEVALLLGVGMIGFMFGGGGRYSIDRLIGREF